MQGVRFQLFGTAHDNYTVLWLNFQILLGSTFRDQEFDDLRGA